MMLYRAVEILKLINKSLTGLCVFTEDSSELWGKHYTKFGVEGGRSVCLKTPMIEMFEEKFEGLKSGLERVLLKTSWFVTPKIQLML